MNHTYHTAKNLLNRAKIGLNTGLLGGVFLFCSSCAPSGSDTKNSAPNPPKAKNVILFIGDGMGVSTITAARIFDGQSQGLSGEDHSLSFETFPNLAMVKTYNLDAQVADSAGTASAMNTGLKTQIGKVNVRPEAPFAGCGNGNVAPPTLLADIGERAGLATGIVSTARITHATPAAVYAHAFSRDWESDSKLDETAREKKCTDIASQLIAYGQNSGDGIDLALGGGRAAFLPKSVKGGRRSDKKNLTQAWQNKSDQHQYVADRASLMMIDPTVKASILGLFSSSHMAFETDRPIDEQPSLSEMTEFAIKSLSARAPNKGYFLMVEAGRIDHGHHMANAYRALSETQELSNAVALADQLTNDDDTLILVTADHSHTFTISGYPKIGNPILGLAKPTDPKWGDKNGNFVDVNGHPYTTLGYQNGPNIRNTKTPLTDEQVQAKNYRQQSAVQLETETHGGEDVVLFAKGPRGDQVNGVIDQKEIFDIITNALALEPAASK